MRSAMLRARCWPVKAVRRPFSRRRYAPGIRSSSCSHSQQMISSAEQVRQRARHLQSMQVLRQAAVANLVEAEDAFDDAEAVLDFRAHLRLGAIAAALAVSSRAGCTTTDCMAQPSSSSTTTLRTTPIISTASGATWSATSAVTCFVRTTKRIRLTIMVTSTSVCT